MKKLFTWLGREKNTKWEKEKCTNCDALFFEIEKKLFKSTSVRIKCRKCKQITIV